MKLNKIPGSGEFFDCEKRAIEFLATSHSCKKRYGNLQMACKSETERHRTIPKASKKGGRVIFKSQHLTRVECSIDVPERNIHSGKILHLGALASTDEKGDLNRYSYYLALQDKVNKKFERKFHFDFDPSAGVKRQNRPYFHLQHGGEASEHLKQTDGFHLGDYALALTPDTSEPRIAFFPFCFPFLISIALLEFDPAGCAGVVNDGGWKNMMKSAEELLLRDWMNTIAANIGQRSIFIDCAYCD